MTIQTVPLQVEKFEETHAHRMRVIDKTGDLKFVWDSENEDEIKTIRNIFDEKKKEGYKAYAVKKDGSPGTQIFKFQPESEKIILVPPMRGG